MFNKILVALDFNDSYTSVFEEAIVLAQATKAQLMLLNVLNPLGDPNSPLMTYPDLGYYPIKVHESILEVYQKHYQEAQDWGLAKLKELSQDSITAGVETQFTQHIGDPGRAICDVARTGNFDLVLVGSHGRKGLGEMLLGSVSNYVMHHAPCSVLVFHEPKTDHSPTPTEPSATAQAS